MRIVLKFIAKGDLSINKDMQPKLTSFFHRIMKRDDIHDVSSEYNLSDIMGFSYNKETEMMEAKKGDIISFVFSSNNINIFNDFMSRMKNGVELLDGLSYFTNEYISEIANRSEMTFTTLTPMVLRNPVGHKYKNCVVGDDNFEEVFDLYIKTIISKKFPDYEGEILIEVNKNLSRYKPTFYKGSVIKSSFVTFTITSSREINQFLYDNGIGLSRGMGMGMLMPSSNFYFYDKFKKKVYDLEVY